MVKFHAEGDRKVDGRWESCWAQYREFHVPAVQREYHNFLHLVDERRVKMFMKVFKYFFHRTEFPRVPEHEEVIETREVVAGVAGEPSVTMERREAEGTDQNRDGRVETAEMAASAGRGGHSGCRH